MASILWVGVNIATAGEKKVDVFRKHTQASWLNQSPDRYYPHANEHKILKSMDQSVNALQHPNTWSKQKH